MFKQAFPEKHVPHEFKMPEYVNMELLIEKVNESPQFLKAFNNLDLKWLCEKEHYDKIILNGYKKFIPKEGTNHENRTYSQEELKRFYTNIEDIQI